MNNIDPYKISEAEKQAQMDEMWKKHEQKDQLYEENDQFVLEDELDIDFCKINSLNCRPTNNRKPKRK